MLSLGKRRLHQQGIVASNDGRLSFALSFLWPLWRRLKRFSSDVFSGHRKIPNHAGSSATLLFFALVIGYGISAGGHGEQTIRTMTSTAGFSIEKIKIAGNRELSDIDILQNLGLDETSSLVTFDLDQAYDDLILMPWVKKIDLRKIYPATLYVGVVESEAFAIWQQGSQLSFIDHTGSVIAPFRGGTHGELPLFVGLGADQFAQDIYQVMQKRPHYMDQVKAYIRVSNRRWDLRFDNGITLNLPEVGMDVALARFEEFDRQQNLLERDIAEIDLRLPDRVTIRLTQDALTRRKQALDLRSNEFASERRI